MFVSCRNVRFRLCPIIGGVVNPSVPIATIAWVWLATSTPIPAEREGGRKGGKERGEEGKRSSNYNPNKIKPFLQRQTPFSLLTLHSAAHSHPGLHHMQFDLRRSQLPAHKAPFAVPLAVPFAAHHDLH